MISANDDILPPHPIVELPLPPEVYVRGGMLTIFAALLGALVVWLFWLRYRKKLKVETSFEKGVKALNDVWSRASQMSDREFAFAASGCVRDYLEAALSLPAPERTTEEFLANLSQYTVFRSHDIAHLLKQILEKCDEAKFAKRKFSKDERANLYKCALDLIEQLNQKTQQRSENINPKKR